MHWLIDGFLVDTIFETFRYFCVHIYGHTFNLHFPPRHLYIANGFIMQDFSIPNRIIFTLSYEKY